MSDVMKHPPRWRYTHCLCGMLVRCESLNEQARKELNLPGPAFFAVCPSKGCNLQVSVGFAPAQLIARPSGPVPNEPPA